MIEIGRNLMIKHRKLEGIEMEVFIYLLTKEKIRHELEIEKINKNRSQFHFNELEKIFWKTSIERHCQDIRKIDKTIKYLTNKMRKCTLKK